MTDREAPAAGRIRAADVVLHGAFRGMEIEDIEARSRTWSGRRTRQRGMACTD